jgi:hypothetical protein
MKVWAFDLCFYPKYDDGELIFMEYKFDCSAGDRREKYEILHDVNGIGPA